VQKPQVGILHTERFDSSIFEEFLSEIEHDNLDLQVQETPEPGPFATVEWFIPTAIIAFIAKAYFEEFLKEMGKDHYNALKLSLAKLTKKTVSQPRIEPVLMSTSGKVSSDNPFSMAYSILAEGNDGYRFKLLIPKYSSSINYETIVLKFMDFIAEYHALGLDSAAAEQIARSGSPGGTILVSYNPETDSIEWRDHLPPEVRARMSVQQENVADS
jgi:hypothetical protein